MKVSVIISTYNWPEALNLVLQGFAAQTYPDYEVLVADDGSTESTTALVEQWQAKQLMALRHVRHPDQGFRLSEIRNRAAAQAQGEYLIFVDGDCVPRPDFIAQHVRLAEPGCFLAGNRIMLRQQATEQILSQQPPIHRWGFKQFWTLYRQGQVKRLHPMLKLPLGPLRMSKAGKWQGAKTCNVSVWHQDFKAINGFDESFVGWGYDDSDLVVRLFNLGIKRKEARFAAPVIHLWHKEASRDAESLNRSKFEYAKAHGVTAVAQGLNNHLND